MPADPPTLLVCSETDDLSGLCEPMRQAAAEWCPGLRIGLWSPQGGLGEIDPASVVALAAWFAPPGLPATLPGLRLIASIGAGVEHVLRDPGLPAGVPITRIVDEQQARGMADFVLWAVLYFHRGLDRVQQQQRQRVWRMPPQRPAVQTRIGVMGLGVMGAEVARCLAGHGFEVHGWSRRPQTIDGVRTWAGGAQLDGFLRTLDMVVSLLPLTDQTRGLCDARWFDRLKPGAAFINCGRGEQVVVSDLIDALGKGQLRGAVLDVFDHEPLPPEHPLWATPGVVVTPHMASSVSDEAMARQIVGDTARVLAWHAPAPMHAIDQGSGY